MSSLCKQVIEVLKYLFPQIKIKTEHFVYYRGQRLFLDILAPQLNLAIEVHGRQHDEFVEHFHGDDLSYREYRRRDSLKEEWAGKEGYIFIVLRENVLPITPDKLLEIIDEKSNG